MFEFMGFKVEKLEGDKNVAYKFTGKRGGIFNLVRHHNNTKLMYVTDRYGNICSIKGNYTFTDENNKLTCWYGQYFL